MSNLDAQSRTDGDVPSPSAGGGGDTGSWPRIADYWPDATRRSGPAPDATGRSGPAPGGESPAGPGGPGDTATRLISPPPRPGRSWLRIFLGALGALVFLGGSVMVLARLVTQSRGGDSSVSAPGARSTAGQDAGGQDLGGVAVPPSPPVSIEPQPSATAAAPGGGSPSPSPSLAPSAKATALPFTAGTLELTGDVVDLNVTVASLGNEAIQVSAPSGSGLRPRATVDGNTLKLAPNPGRAKGSGRLEVRLNSRIAWSLKIVGGVTTGKFDLFRAALRRIDLVGGAAKLDMRLPSPAGGVPIRMSGGVNTWEITTAEKVPIRVRLRDGGGVATLNGHRTTGIGRGALLRDDTGDGGPLVIDAVAGLGTLIVGPLDD